MPSFIINGFFRRVISPNDKIGGAVVELVPHADYLFCYRSHLLHCCLLKRLTSEINKAVIMPETCCVVPNCSQKGRHIFPKDKARHDAWVQAIKRGKSTFEKWTPPSKYSYICERHFTEEDYHGLTYSGKRLSV